MPCPLRSASSRAHSAHGRRSPGRPPSALGHLHNTLFGPDVPETDIALPPAHIIAFSDGTERDADRDEADNSGRDRKSTEALG